MRLGYMVPDFPSQTHAFFWNEIVELRRLGAEIFVLSTRKPAVDSCKHEFAAAARAETKYLFPPSPIESITGLPTGISRGIAALRYLGELSPDPKVRWRRAAYVACALDIVGWARATRIDHIHGHSCAESAHILALAFRLGGPPYSLTLHGDLDVYGVDHAQKFAGATFVCAVGQHLCRQIVEKAGVPQSKVRSSFMGIPTEKLIALGHKKETLSNRLRLATVARLHPNKGHMYALQAVRKARDVGLDVTYKIAGEGPFKSEILSKIAALQLGDAVELLGTVSQAEVLEILASSDAFLLPSIGKGEAWPVAVMEAMGAGLPVIASIIGATPEMIKPEVDGFLVPQRDENAVFELIVRLSTDLNLRDRIGKAARLTAVERFDVSVSAKYLLDTINAFR